MVIVVAEGAGQELMADSIRSMGHEDASGNKLLLDVGLWLSHKIKVRYTRNFFCLPSISLATKIYSVLHVFANLMHVIK